MSCLRIFPLICIFSSLLGLFSGKVQAQPKTISSRVIDLIRSGEPNRALELLNIFPRNAIKTGEYYFLRGRAMQELKFNAEALINYSIAIYIQPTNVKAFINRALVRGALRDLDGAITDLNQASQLDPKNSIVFLNRGVTFASLGKPRLALSDFTKAISLNPRYADAYVNRGIIKVQLDDLSGACLDWKKSLELGSLDAQPWMKQSCQSQIVSEQN